MKLTLAISLALVSMTNALPAVGLPPNEDANCTHGNLTIVTEQTTLEDFAAKNDLNPEDLIRVNSHVQSTNPSIVFTGETICALAPVEPEVLPPAPKTPPATTGPEDEHEHPGQKYDSYYALTARIPESCIFGSETTVVEDDTLFQFAEKNGVDLAIIKSANPQFSPDFDLIYPGDVVCIPESCYPNRQVEAEDMCEAILDVVEKGETLFTIAMEKNLDLQTLIDANPHIQNPNHIFPGDSICQPRGCPSYQSPVVATTGDIAETEVEAEEELENDGDEELEEEYYSTDGDKAAYFESSARSVTVSLLVGVATLFASLL
jgi:LysM repeat protein